MHTEETATVAKAEHPADALTDEALDSMENKALCVGCSVQFCK